MEPSGPTLVDTAVPVRIECAHALMTTRPSDALILVAPLLADEEAAVRAGAAEAVGRSATPGAAAVLLLKLKVGDDEPEVLGACMSGLLTSDPERFVGEVERYLS